MKINYLEKLDALTKQVTKDKIYGSYGWCGILKHYEFRVWHYAGDWTVYIPVHDRLTLRQVYLKALKECKKEGLI